MRRFIEEFPQAFASSRKTELSTYVAGLLPSVILLFGVMVVGRIEFPDPYAALAVPIRQGFLFAFGALAAVAFVKLASLASSNYRKARDRLFE
jgi:hypothetical protein